MAMKRIQNGGDQAGNAAAGGAQYIQQLTETFIAAIPQIIGALIILAIGWVLGKAIGGLVTRLVDRVEVDKATQRTPLGDMMGGTEKAISKTFGKIAKWFIYALAVLAAADILAITLLSQWISQAISYLPAFIGGLLIILLGFIAADFIGDIMERTRATTNFKYTSIFSDAVRAFLYFIVIVIGLETMGVDVGILYIFARALSWGLALGIGLAVALAFGLGGQEYIRDNIEEWTGRAREGATESE